jgi:hypothetical protein
MVVGCPRMSIPGSHVSEQKKGHGGVTQKSCRRPSPYKLLLHYPTLTRRRRAAVLVLLSQQVVAPARVDGVRALVVDLVGA